MKRTPFREKDLGIETYLKIVPSDSGHVFDGQHCHVSGFDLFQKSSEAGAVEIGSCVAIICKVADILESFGAGEVFQIFLLVGNAVGFALILIVSGKPLVERSNLFFSHIAPTSFPSSAS